MRAQKPSRKVVDAVLERAARPNDVLLCEKCGKQPPAEIHHRTGRQMGGSREKWVNQPGNLLALCASCHHGVTHTKGQREFIETCGWLVRRGQVLPAAIPVVLWHDLVLLDDHGNYTPALENA